MLYSEVLYKSLIDWLIDWSTNNINMSDGLIDWLIDYQYHYQLCLPIFINYIFRVVNYVLFAHTLQKQGVRIVVGNFYENYARTILCEAYKEEMYGTNYAWILTGLWTLIGQLFKRKKDFFKLNLIIHSIF